MDQHRDSCLNSPRRLHNKHIWLLQQGYSRIPVPMEVIEAVESFTRQATTQPTHSSLNTRITVGIDQRPIWPSIDGITRVWSQLAGKEML